MASLQMKGKYSFSLDEIPEETYVSRNALTTMIHRFKNYGRLFFPYKKFYTIITPGYKKIGSIPILWYIDDLMKHLDAPYYISLRSAASVHCADNSQPQTI